MNAAMVAVPTLITAEVLIPARIVGAASGSSILVRIVPARMPSDCAACLMPTVICVSAVCVLRTMGSSAYSARAMNAGTAPMRPVRGISTARRASDGIVCATPVAPRISPSVAGRLAARMPSGMPMTMLAASDMNTSPRCSSVRRAKSGPKSLLQKSPAGAGLALGDAAAAVPGRCARKPAATVAKSLPSSSAAAFILRMVASSILPSSCLSAAHVFGNRCGRSAR